MRDKPAFIRTVAGQAAFQMVPDPPLTDAGQCQLHEIPLMIITGTPQKL